MRLQGRQEVRECVDGDVDPLGEFDEGEGVPRLRRAAADLGDGGVEFREQGGRDFVAFDGFREKGEEPGFEGAAKSGMPRCVAHGVAAFLVSIVKVSSS